MRAEERFRRRAAVEPPPEPGRTRFDQTLRAWFEEMLRDALASPRLSPWEMNFCRDLNQQHLRGDLPDLTDKQLGTLRRIEGKIRVAGQGAATDRRAMLAKVHLAKKELALADDSYRALLARVTGQDSSGTCTNAQLEAVLGEFKRLGWTPRVRRPASNVPHVRKIYALWGALRPYLRNPSREALCAFVKRQTASVTSPDGVDQPEWLDGKQANKVIEALRAWIKRAKEGGDENQG